MSNPLVFLKFQSSISGIELYIPATCPLSCIEDMVVYWYQGKSYSLYQGDEYLNLLNEMRDVIKSYWRLIHSFEVQECSVRDYSWSIRGVYSHLTNAEIQHSLTSFKPVANGLPLPCLSGTRRVVISSNTSAYELYIGDGVSYVVDRETLVMFDISDSNCYRDYNRESLYDLCFDGFIHREFNGVHLSWPAMCGWYDFIGDPSISSYSNDHVICSIGISEADESLLSAVMRCRERLITHLSSKLRRRVEELGGLDLAFL